MELLDGFIVSIFNYCDRWCERCAFTPHCRLFADMARADAAIDPSLAAVMHAPASPDEAPLPLHAVAGRADGRSRIASGEHEGGGTGPV